MRERASLEASLFTLGTWEAGGKAKGDRGSCSTRLKYIPFARRTHVKIGASDLEDVMTTHMYHAEM